jgi:signal transduction histidine kinase
MLPRGLRSRIVLAFVGLAATMLVAVAGTLFFVLHEAHLNETKSRLGNDVVLIEASLIRRPGTTAATQVEQAVQDYGSLITDEGGFILVAGPKGVVRVLAGNASWTDIPPGPTDGSSTAIGTLKSFVYIEPDPAGTRQLTFVFAVPDMSAQQAFSDMGRALLIMIIVLALVGAPIAWLLSRSLTGPMQRLANAAAALPAGAAEPAALPLEGPTEVRVLTERFNAMVSELTATRNEEAQMLANLRHDLRTPLTSIGGYAEAIADGTASGDRAASAARTIAEEAQRLERLVGELGLVERLRQGPAALRPEFLDATALMAEAAARFDGRASGQGATIEATPAGPGEAPPAFTGDRLAAERILQNLIENALSVVPRGGHVWLRATPLQMPGRSPGISMSVTDDGPGFPPGTTERVFERFYRADPSRTGSGSGLGLAIVRELARAHGGEAWAENVAPHGARVTVLLPIKPAIPVTVADPGGASPATAG